MRILFLAAAIVGATSVKAEQGGIAESPHTCTQIAGFCEESLRQMKRSPDICEGFKKDCIASGTWRSSSTNVWKIPPERRK